MKELIRWQIVLLLERNALSLGLDTLDQTANHISKISRTDVRIMDDDHRLGDALAAPENQLTKRSIRENLDGETE